MIICRKEGSYELIKSKGHHTLLILDKKSQYIWVFAEDIGELLVLSDSQHTVDYVLAKGHYRLYDVVDEAHLTDLQHLELAIGKGQWQGYLILTQLPTETKRKSKIIPTEEIITKSTRRIPYPAQQNLT